MRRGSAIRQGSEGLGGEGAGDVLALRVVADRRSEQYGDEGGAGGDDGLVEPLAAGGAAGGAAEESLAGLRETREVQADVEPGVAEDEEAAHAMPVAQDSALRHSVA